MSCICDYLYIFSIFQENVLENISNVLYFTTTKCWWGCLANFYFYIKLYWMCTLVQWTRLQKYRQWLIVIWKERAVGARCANTAWNGPYSTNKGVMSILLYWELIFSLHTWYGMHEQLTINIFMTTINFNSFYNDALANFQKKLNSQFFIIYIYIYIYTSFSIK